MNQGAPRTFGPFLLGRELGRGSGGVVFLATRKGDPERYALKINTAHTDRETLIRLQLEAQVTARLDHPGIVRVRDQGVIDGRHYLLMELCEGESLAEHLKRGGFEWRQATELVRDLARIMSVAHAAGVIHRDLKPANVMLEARSGKPRIIDFGLARDPSLVRSLTQSREVLGTPTTMAPEQFRGEKVDPRADVYALGAILYSCLTGHPPFTTQDRMQLEQQVRSEEPAPPRRQVRDLPLEVERVCLAALAKQPDWRPKHAGAFADELDAALAAFSAPGARPRRRAGPPAWALILGSVGLGILALAVWQFSGSAPAREPTLTRESRLDAVRPVLERCRERAHAFASLEELLEILDEAQALAGDDMQALDRVRLARADAHRRRGDYLQAIAEAPVGAEGKVGFEARHTVALSYLRLERDLECKQTFQDLARDDPEGDRGRHAAALLLILEGAHWNEIESAVRGADPALPQSRMIAAYGLATRERGAEAIALVEGVAREEPDDPHAYSVLGMLHLLAGDLEGAVAAYDKIMELVSPRLSISSLLGRARALAGLGDFKRALADCDRALIEQPARCWAHIFRGLMLYQMRRDAEAKQAWVRACEVRIPSSWDDTVKEFPEDIQQFLRETVKRLEREGR